MTTGAAVFLTFLILQRFSELAIARRNTRNLMAEGAREVAPRHYPLIVALHTCWILTLMVFRYDQPIHIGWLLIFGLIQMFRVWVLATLGRRWTTRIIVTDEPLVARGPYRWLTHPNYILVVCEIAVAPLVLGLWWVTVVFTVLNAVVLNIRIRAENDALAAKRSA